MTTIDTVPTVVPSFDTPAGQGRTLAIISAGSFIGKTDGAQLLFI